MQTHRFPRQRHKRTSPEREARQRKKLIADLQKFSGYREELLAGKSTRELRQMHNRIHRRGFSAAGQSLQPLSQPSAILR